MGRFGYKRSVESFYVAGEWRTGEGSFPVTSPYDGSVVAEIAKPADADVERAVAAAAAGFEETRTLPAHVRASALAHVSQRISERSEELA
jgi:acyl-CoA reductase-like NAD-dependent aldehyde dehydrogenase